MFHPTHQNTINPATATDVEFQENVLLDSLDHSKDHLRNARNAAARLYDDQFVEDLITIKDAIDDAYTQAQLRKEARVEREALATVTGARIYP